MRLDVDVPLFAGAELAELHRMAEDERVREVARVKARRERVEQGLPEKVEMELWD